MAGKKISRKEFVTKTLTGIVGISDKTVIQSKNKLEDNESPSKGMGSKR